jgi:peptide-methionine (S)-S-oxide reductase
MAAFTPSLASRAIRFTLMAGAASLLMLGVVFTQQVHGQEAPLLAPRKLPAPALDAPAGGGMQTAVLSGGCFWGVQGVFEHVKGVRQVLAGYAGGRSGATAQYELVSTGTTGHAESVKIIFDPAQISYGEILRIFFSVATDPTQVGGQYPDRGPQYRTEIFYMDATQKDVAERYIAQLSAAHVFPRPIATRIDAFSGFYPAEAYHQNYLYLHPDQPYIAEFDLPKVQALATYFPANYRSAPVLAPKL